MLDQSSMETLNAGGELHGIRSMLYLFLRFVNEADELVNMDYMKLAEKMSDVCSSTGG